MPTEAKKKALRTGEYLDVELFVQALAVCAIKSKGFERDPAPAQKILHLMEKMTQSTGVAKVKKVVGRTR